MPRKTIHCCLDIQGGIKNARFLHGCITVDGRTLNAVSEVREFLRGELSKGRKVLPMGDCDNFDYQLGCLGHEVPEGDDDF